MTCCHPDCRRPVTVIDMSRYQNPVKLCSKHYNELSHMTLGSREERLFLYRCGIVRDEAMDTCVKRVAKVL